MRAMMSQGNHPDNPERTALYLRTIAETPLNVNVWERVAEVEARAILAATEPAAETVSFYWRDSKGVSHHEREIKAEYRTLDSIPARYNSLGETLAESLAAFIALEIS